MTTKSNSPSIFHDPINLAQLAGKAEERRAQAVALKRLSRIGWIGFAGTILPSFLAPAGFIFLSSSLLSVLAIITIAAIGFIASLVLIGSTLTAQHRRLRSLLVLRQEANDLIRQLMPDLPDGHHPLLAGKSRVWYWFYFAVFVVIQVAMLIFFPMIYPVAEVSSALFPSFTLLPFYLIILYPTTILWTIWYDLWMGQSILSIWRWIRHGTEPERGLHCLIHGISLIILTLLPLLLLQIAHQASENLASLRWVIMGLLWLYYSQFLGKYMIFFPHDWITKPISKGHPQQSFRRIKLLKMFRPYNPGLHQANAILTSFSGQYLEAEQAYRKVLAENPPIENQIMCLANLVDSLMEQRKYQQAIAVLDVIMYIAPEMNLNYLNLAEIYLVTRTNPTRALEILEIGLEQQDGILADKRQKARFEGAFWVAKAWALAELGLHQSAYDALQQGWSPANLKKASRMTQANMHYMTGRIYYLESQIDQAIASFQKACELHPAGAVAQRAQVALNHLQSRNTQEIA